MYLKTLYGIILKIKNNNRKKQQQQSHTAYSNDDVVVAGGNIRLNVHAYTR